MPSNVRLRLKHGRHIVKFIRCASSSLKVTSFSIITLITIDPSVDIG